MFYHIISVSLWPGSCSNSKRNAKPKMMLSKDESHTHTKPSTLSTSRTTYKNNADIREHLDWCLFWAFSIAIPDWWSLKQLVRIYGQNNKCMDNTNNQKKTYQYIKLPCGNWTLYFWLCVQYCMVYVLHTAYKYKWWYRAALSAIVGATSVLIINRPTHRCTDARPKIHCLPKHVFKNCVFLYICILKCKQNDKAMRYTGIPMWTQHLDDTHTHTRLILVAVHLLAFVVVYMALYWAAFIINFIQITWSGNISCFCFFLLFIYL